MKSRSASALALLCLLLTACSSLPPLDQSLSEYAVSQASAAEEAERDNRLAQALNLWRSQLPLNYASSDVAAAIERLEKKIRVQSKRALAQGEAAYAAGNTRAGDTWMLKVLALQPGHVSALANLRTSTSRQAQAQQAKKVQNQQTWALPHPNPSPDPGPAEGSELMLQYFDLGNYQKVIALGSNSEGVLTDADATLVRSSHIALADKAASQNNQPLELEHLQAAASLSPRGDPLLQRISSLRILLSEDWYRKGSGMINLNLNGAISAFEKSITYNPENAAAKLKLKQARRLQRNLEKIKKG